MIYQAYDTETTGLPLSQACDDPYDTLNWPRVYQVGSILFDEYGIEYGRMNAFVRPDGWKIPIVDAYLRDMGERDFHAEQEITTEMLMDVGRPIADVLDEFIELAKKADESVCHNASFDYPIITCEMFRRKKFPVGWMARKRHCTKLMSEGVLKIPGYKGMYKWPSLQEAYVHFYGKEFDGAHDALADVQATVDVFLELIQL